MFLTRFAAVVGAFVFAILVSALSGTELFKVFALASFILVVDTLTVKYITNLYLQSVYEEMQKGLEKDKEDKNDTGT